VYLNELHVRSRHEYPLARNLHAQTLYSSLFGRVTDVKVSGLLAQVALSLDGQPITSIMTADAVRELRLQKGQVAAALSKSTEVMIVLTD
jgi:molybdopterin-binding protein